MEHSDENFSAYLDGELEPSERKAIEAHVAECASCSEKLDQFRNLKMMLSSASSIEPSPEFSRKVMERIEQDTRSRRLALTRWTILGLAAAIVLLVLILRIQQESNPPVPSVRPKIIVSKPPKPEAPKQKSAPPKRPVIVKKEPERLAPQPLPEQKQEPAKIVDLKPAQPEPEAKATGEELSSEEMELIANLDELENMDLIANYDQLQNLDVALITSEEERKE